MSYILEALKKAESERERGSVPNVHARPMLPAAASERAAAGKTAPLVWALGCAVLLLAAVLAWRLLAPPAVQATAPAPAEIRPVTNAGPAEGAVPAPSGASSAAASAAPQDAPGAAAEAPRELAPIAAAPPPPPGQRPPPARAPAATPAASAAAPAVAAPAAGDPVAAAAAVPPAPQRRVHARHELPDQIQRELPQLAVGGSIYSTDPAGRMLILSGRVFREGDSLGPEHALSQIGLKAAVLEYKGFRYSIDY
jgi:general secretion pathway protein B